MKKSYTATYKNLYSFSVLITTLFCVFIWNTSSVEAGINEVIYLEGKIVNADGTNATATCISANTCDFRLSIYDSQTGGSLLWQETQTDVIVNDGIFNLKIGSVSTLNNINLQNFNRSDLYFQLEFDPSGTSNFAAPEIFTRSRLAAVPYSMNSKYLNGIASTSFLRGDSSDLYWDSVNKRLGFGTSVPASTLSIGANSEFQINSAGNILKINNVSYSWPTAQGALNTVLQNDGAGNLTWVSTSGSLPSFTAGSIIFSNGTTLSQNNTNFFWNDTSKALAIGTNSTTAKVNISLPNGVENLPGLRIDNADTTNNTSSIVENISGTGTGLVINYIGTGTTASGITIANTSSGVITNALDVSDPEIVNAINLGQNNILSYSDGVVEWNDSAGHNLANFRDIGTNFGMLIDTGGILERNSKFEEEFTMVRTTVTTDTTGINDAGMGDAGGWGTYSLGGNNTCTFSNVLNETNGATRIQSNNASNGCLMMVDSSLRVPLRFYNVANLPVVSMKTEVSAVSANNTFFIGLGDLTDGRITDPTNFIGFTNNGGTTWTARTSNAGASTNVSCGLTVSTSVYAVTKIEVRSSTDIHFFVDDDTTNGVSWTECGTGISTNIPSGNLGPQLMYQVRAAGIANTFLNVDFFRSIQDDAPSKSLTSEPVSIKQNEDLPDYQDELSDTVIPETILPVEDKDKTNTTSITYAPVFDSTALLELLGTISEVKINDLFLSGGLTVSGNALFLGEIDVNGSIVQNTDAAGIVSINLGESTVRVNYLIPKTSTTIVTASLTQNPNEISNDFSSVFAQDLKYAVVSSESTGFTIVTSVPVESETYFAWHSIQIK